MKDRAYALDFLRSLMMFLGIVFHCLVLFNPSLSWSNEQISSGFFKLLYITLHSFRMPLFFFLSGFFACMLLQKMGTKNFLKNRFQRIAVPFALAVCTIAPLTNHLFQVLENSTEDLSVAERFRLLSSFENVGLSYFKQPHHLWFLNYLCAFILTMVPVHFLIRRFKSSKAYSFLSVPISKIGVPASVLLVTIPTSVYFLYTGKEEIPIPYQSLRIKLESFLPFLYYFLCGWVFYFFRFDPRRLIRNGKAYLLIAFAGSIVHWLLCPAATLLPFLVDVVVYPLSIWLFVFGFLGVVHSYVDKPLPGLQYFSDASYWIYLVHMPAIVLLRLFVTGEVSLGLFAILIVITFVFGLLSYNYMVRSSYLGKVLCGKRLPRHSMRRLGKSVYEGYFARRVVTPAEESI